MQYRRVAKVALGAILLVAVAAFIVQAFPSLVGADYALTVQSGSMEPEIGTGSVVFVTETTADSVDEGDVITYTDDGDNLITHRVVEVHRSETSVRFITKGDANENRDAEPVYRSELVGKVMFSIPYMGYVVAFGGTRMGYLTLVLVPCVLLIFNEIWELYRAGMAGDNDHE